MEDPQDPGWGALYNSVCTGVTDGLLEPDALLLSPAAIAPWWSLTTKAAQKAYTALERDGLLGRCPDCLGWVVLPMKACRK